MHMTDLFATMEAWKPIGVPYVLIVESDPSIASLLQAVLSQEMHLLTMVVITMADSLNVTKGLKPTLFLIDTHLRDGDGITLYDYLHHRKDFEDVPALILSTNLVAYQQHLKIRHLDGLGLPLDMGDFIQTIRRIMS